MRFFGDINQAKGNTVLLNFWEFLRLRTVRRDNHPSQPQTIAAFGLINSRTPLEFTFLAPQTADGFVICLNHYCNKEANSVS